MLRLGRLPFSVAETGRGTPVTTRFGAAAPALITLTFPHAHTLSSTRSWQMRFGPPAVVGSSHALTGFDLESRGPLKAYIYTGGALTKIHGALANVIGRWDKSARVSVVGAMNATVRALHAGDDYGVGPLLLLRYIGRCFATAGTSSLRSIGMASRPPCRQGGGAKGRRGDRSREGDARSREPATTRHPAGLEPESLSGDKRLNVVQLRGTNRPAQPQLRHSPGIYSGER